MSDWLNQYMQKDVENRKFALELAVTYCMKTNIEDVPLIAQRFLSFIYGIPQWHGYRECEIKKIKQENADLKKQLRILTKTGPEGR